MVKNFNLTKADKYFIDTLKEIIYQGDWDKNPRPKWDDGSNAYTKFLTQKFFKYNIQKGEFPIITMRNTPLKAAFYDIKAIYIDQTNNVDKMNKSIRNWWRDFTIRGSSLGSTYGYIVNKYNLMDKLLYSMENNPFSRRHIIDLWQYSEQNNSPESLVPCAFQTMWSVKESIDKKYDEDKDGAYYTPVKIRLVDLTLVQRSMDYLVTASINPAQYVMLGMMVCNHLSYKTGIEHRLDNFSHLVQNLHIYDRHIETAEHILEKIEPQTQPLIKLKCKHKYFYHHTIEDFEFENRTTNKLNYKLEIAV